jgi:hypothetical protein
MMAEQECHEEVSRRGELQPCNRVAVAMRIDPTFGDPYPVCAFHARGSNMMSLSAVEASVRADMQLEVRTGTYVLHHPHHGTIYNVEIAEGVTAETVVELPFSITGFAHWQDAQYLQAMGWTVTPSTPNQQGAERK